MTVRIPEPMVMDDGEAVAAFDAVHPVLQAPWYAYNSERLAELLPPGGHLLDLGSGSGRMLREVAALRPDVTITGVELSPAMVAAGRTVLADVADRVTLRRGDMTALDGERADVVSCVWALHHLPDRATVLAVLREMARVRAEHGAALWLFDFVRLPDAEIFPAALARVPDVPERLRHDAIASERAAWTVDELRELLDEAGLGEARGGAHPERPYLQAWSLT